MTTNGFTDNSSMNQKDELNIKGNEVIITNESLKSKYFIDSQNLISQLNAVSPSFCLAKWFNVSIHIPTGQTHSCYHPRSHHIPIDEIKIDVSALHNTVYKKSQRKMMINGHRPKECNFCWQIEDSGNQLSDRAYRSQDIYSPGIIEQAVEIGYTKNADPKYLEVNFNQSCNFKCSYCSPHLSNTWMNDIEKNGPYILHDRTHNDLTWMKEQKVWPNNSPDNPYLLAFWEWFPKIYNGLHTFRMTGGEPLMDKNTFRIFDYIKNNPKADLHLSITSNCCPPGNQWKKFLNDLKDINDKNAIDHFMLYCSLDSWGPQAEYIRNGMNFEILHRNICQFLLQGDRHSLTFIITFNILSYSRIFDFLKNILLLRKRYNSTRQLIWFDIPQLQYPEWLSAQLYPQLSTELHRCLDFMKNNLENIETRTNGFKDFEVSKIQRLIDWINSPITFNENVARKNFATFIDEYDKRNGTDFKITFPELINFYETCKV